MTRRHSVLFITIVPSPYQRDLFGALAEREEIDLRVCYMEDASPDSPWPKEPLRPFEQVLPGFWLPLGNARAHVNWRLPHLQDRDFVILSGTTTLSVQWLMRGPLRQRRWIFWGERLGSNSGFKGWMQRALAAPLSTASAIVGIGSEAEADYRRRFPHVPHFCIPYYCDLSLFLATPRRPRPPSPVTFLFCGQMIRRKGVDVLLAAFDRLVTKGIEAELLLVGREADLAQFMAAASPLAQARVRYAGFQPPNRLPQFFADSDVFVLPSRHDGWGVVINQALGAGLPIISSEAAGAGRDLVKHGMNGLHVRSGSVEELCAAMEILARDPLLRSRWGEASRRKALLNTPQAGAAKWVSIFQSFMTAGVEEGKEVQSA